LEKGDRKKNKKNEKLDNHCVRKSYPILVCVGLGGEEDGSVEESVEESDGESNESNEGNNIYTKDVVPIH